MSAGNLIEVSFGKPVSTPSGGAAHICDENIPSASIAEFSRYHDGTNCGFFTRMQVVLVLVKQCLFTMGLAVSKEDRAWLQNHPKLVEDILARVIAIRAGDGRKWQIDRTRKAIIRFPPDFPERIRLFFFTEEQNEELEYDEEEALFFTFEKE